MTLLELQRRMAAAVLQPLTADHSMREATSDGRSMSDEADVFIKPNDRLSSFERLEIYNRQYWFRLIGSLAEDFPGLAAVIGSKSFDRLTIAYLNDHPSSSFTLRNLGSHLESWLVQHPEFCGSRRELALDTVRLEWAHIEALDSAELTPLTLPGMAAVDESSRFTLQPHLRLLALNHGVDDLLIDVHSNQNDTGAASNAVAEPTAHADDTPQIDLPVEPICLAVHRHEETVYYKRLEPEAFQLLKAIGSGHPLGEALEAAFSDSLIPEDERQQCIGEWFSNWAELGWLCPLQAAEGPQDEN